MIHLKGRASEKRGERITKMKEDPDGFREKEATGRQQRREQEMENDHEAYNSKRASEKSGERMTQMKEDPDGFREGRASEKRGERVKGDR